MFKRLKQRINEEQTPQKNAPSPPQAQMGSGEHHGSQANPFQQDGAPSPSDREMLAGMIAEPAFLSEYTIFALDHSKQPKSTQVASVVSFTPKGPSRTPRSSINGDESASPQREEAQSFAQKLQFKVPSMESLIRGGASRAENLFRSPSRENLVRSSSRDSLTALGDNESPGPPSYDPSSDIESEAEEPPGSVESLSKEQLSHRLLRVERSLGKYRGKYSELVIAYRTVQRDKEKTQVILSQSQDKALRRMGELREELQMDQQAKKHLQDEFDAALEEKDQMISVLQTQVALLKMRAKGFSDGPVPSEGEVPQSDEASESSSQSPLKAEDAEPEATAGEGNADPTKLLEVLQKRVKRQENLLQKCKELIRTHKERSAQLSTESETLQEQLQERLQELEKMKELHTTEKTKLITQLRDAKNLIEQLEQDKGMVIAETKRQMHETFEMKEDEVSQLRSRLQQVTVQKEELQEQKEKAEKSAFEELERALGVAQRTEEARKQLQAQLEDQVNEVVRTSEEERKSLQQELTRVKLEVVTIMKKSSEETVANLEKLHGEALAAKEDEISGRINKAVEQCKAEFAQFGKEQEQQASLALEDAELQKSALKAEGDNKFKEAQLDLEVARTRILELESSLQKISHEESPTSRELSRQIEELQIKNEAESSALKEMNKEQLQTYKEIVTQQHGAALVELKEKLRVEMATLLKEKELQFQTVVEEMNEKTVEKLKATQGELETISTQLSEALQSKEILEEKLKAAEDGYRLAQEEHEERFQKQEAKHNVDMETIKRDLEECLAGIEKTLKDELNALTIVLGDREKDIEERIMREKALREEFQDLNFKVKDFKELQQRLSQSLLENESLKKSNAQLSESSENLDQSKKDLKDLKLQLVKANNDCQQKEKSLQELECELQQIRQKLLEQEKSFSAELDIKKGEQTHSKKQHDEEKAALEKKMKDTKSELEAKLKTQETKLEKIKQKAKDMHESFKKKIKQNEETTKKELEKKEKELQQKEKQIQEKILEMAQQSSQGHSSAISELQANHKEELEKLHDMHRAGIEKLERCWQETLGQQEEELSEKHSHTLQEKAQELEEISVQLGKGKEENQQVLCEIQTVKEDLAIRETTVQKLQEELNEAGVKLESLSQAEVFLKEQIESVEKNLKQALNERNALQDLLNTTKGDSSETLKVVSVKLEETETQLKALQGSRSMESEDMRSKFEDNVTRLQAKEETICTLEETIREQTVKMNNLCISLDQMTVQVNAQMERAEALTQEKENLSLSVSERVQEIEELSEANKTISESMKANESLISNLESLVSDLKDQVGRSLKEKEEAINNLNQQYTEERKQAAETTERLEQERSSALEQLHALRNELSEYEKKAETESTQDTMSSLQAKLEGLERELSGKNEALERLTADIDNRSISKSEMDQVLSEKEQKIGGLTAELEDCISRLDGLQERLALKTKQWEDLRDDLQQQHGIWENEKRALVEQLDQTQMKCSQSGSLVQEMEGKLRSLEEDNQQWKEQLKTQSGEFQKIKDEIVQDKEASLKASEERLSAESARKMSELKKKAEQKISQIKKQLTSQLEGKEQTIKTLQTSLEEIKSHETSSERQRETLEEKTKILSEAVEGKEQTIRTLQTSLEEIKGLERSSKQHRESLEEKIKLCEEALEEKEQTIRTLLTSLEEIKSHETSSKQHTETLENSIKALEESLGNLKEEQEKQLEQLLNNEMLEKDKALEEVKIVYQDRLASLQRDLAQQGELKENESMLHEIEAKLKEAEEQNKNLQAEMDELKGAICQKDAQLDQHQEAIKQIHNSSQAEAELKVECSSTQQTGSPMGNHAPTEEVDGDLRESLKNKLSRVKNEKEKIQKDFVRLQKDIRLLRKEHELDLEHTKKDLSEENEKRLKLELEDMEMKHNSAIKQLMREFNTRVASKENDVDTAVREAIVKAQHVEADLISSHREEVSQLRQLVAQKDEDIHRTVQKYEQVIESREAEMGDKVCRVQKELEKLQEKNSGSAEISIEALQAHLGEKTTLLSESRLKEQGFVEKIHILEDKIKCLRRTAVVTHLGTTYKDPVFSSTGALSEATEMEYLKKVLFEYMMGRETRTMAKVITSMLKFPPDQAQQVLENEDSKAIPWFAVNV
ncbi:golgin subfamily A member 4 [Brachionichthys hirsutus]|uniref:golgin subfamily A member 4 n=1 Tax=Brachionichthys hirsutus TaxID=412623 RepID=UPI003604E4FE